MSRSFSESLDRVFGAPTGHEAYNLLKTLYREHPYSQHVPVLDGADGAFPIFQYLESIEIPYCTYNRVTNFTGDEKLTLDTFVIYPYNAEQQQVVARQFFGKFAFTYKDIEFLVYKASWRGGYFFDLVFGTTDETIGKALASAVYKYALTLKEEIWMYQFGQWSRDKELYAAIQQSRWEDIVLDETFKDNLQKDVHQFFKNKAVYEALDITWKRGILLLGPPGNGKTESIKVLLKNTKYPAR